MKAERLMVGDWVRFPIGNDKIVDLPYVEGKGICASFAASATLFPVPAAELQPIPLTSEILEKNGFKNISVVIIGTRKMRWVSDDTRTEITIWMDDTLPMEIVKNVYYEDEVTYTLPFPCTVSQLQHSLRLCGIEKEITV